MIADDETMTIGIGIGHLDATETSSTTDPVGEVGTVIAMTMVADGIGGGVLPLLLGRGSPRRI